MIFDVIFSDFFGWEWRTLAILRQNPNEIAVLYGCGFGLKNLGLGQTPPHPNFYRKFVLKAPLSLLTKVRVLFTLSTFYYTLLMVELVNLVTKPSQAN